MVMQRLMCASRLNEAPYAGDINENEQKRRNSRLLVVLERIHLDLRVNFASPNQPLFCWGGEGEATVESSLSCKALKSYKLYTPPITSTHTH